jgi:hypothetical protein
MAEDQMSLQIGYLSEPESDYTSRLTAATNLRALREVVSEYRLIADDAFQQVKPMNGYDFDRFRRGLLSERRGKFAGMAGMNRFGAIPMPEIMMRVHMIADQFKVPWGLAYIRLRDAGRIVEKDGVATLVDPAGRG